jgi:hypothetical protein
MVPSRRQCQAQDWWAARGLERKVEREHVRMSSRKVWMAASIGQAEYAEDDRRPMHWWLPTSLYTFCAQHREIDEFGGRRPP